MKIALCLEFPIDQHGGTEVLVSELIRGFAKQHQVVLVSPDDAASLARSKIAPFVAGHISFSSVWDSVARARELAKKIAQAGPDVAHFHLGGNYGFGNRLPFRSPIIHLDRLGIPCVSTVHSIVGILDGFCGSQRPAWFKILKLPLAWCGKMQQLSHVRFEIAVSQHDLKKIEGWYAPFRGKFVQIYHSRLPQTAAPPSSAGRKPVILNVGHIAWRKGQLVLAEAFARIAGRYPEWTLQLAGKDLDGISSEPVCRLIKDRRLDGRIQLLGERTDVFELMRRAAIYVQPSFEEALGLALQEAMFCGCACIGSRVGGIPELIREGKTGLLFEPGDVAQLACAIEQFICDETRRNDFGRAAAGSISEMGMTAGGMVRRHLELYEIIAKKS
jgi:glycosyltransferase involved in cell wall biosynthesis